jgi:hypothetical protein
LTLAGILFGFRSTKSQVTPSWKFYSFSGYGFPGRGFNNLGAAALAALRYPACPVCLHLARLCNSTICLHLGQTAMIVEAAWSRNFRLVVIATAIAVSMLFAVVGPGEDYFRCYTWMVTEPQRLSKVAEYPWTLNPYLAQFMAPFVAAGRPGISLHSVVLP